MTNDRQSESNEATADGRALKICTLLDHPRLTRTNYESICTFLQRYNQNSTTFLARAKQITSESLSTEAVKPVNHKLCVKVKFLKFSIALELIRDATHHDTVTDQEVRCNESKDLVTLDKLDKLVQTKLSSDMKNFNATALYKICLRIITCYSREID